MRFASNPSDDINRRTDISPNRKKPPAVKAKMPGRAKTAAAGRAVSDREDRSEKIRRFVAVLMDEFSLPGSLRGVLPRRFEAFAEELMDGNPDHHPRPGQILFEAASTGSPCGIRTQNIHHVPIKLTMYTPEDARMANRTDLLQSRIRRLTREAHAQGALLTQKELSTLLGVGLRTLHRHIKSLQRQGQSVPTRGCKSDMEHDVLP